MAITNTYRGKPGCGCGCRGTYSTGKAAITKRLAEMADAIRGGAQVELTVCDDQKVCLAHENPQRYLWIYFASRAEAEAFAGAALLSKAQ